MIFLQRTTFILLLGPLLAVACHYEGMLPSGPNETQCDIIICPTTGSLMFVPVLPVHDLSLHDFVLMGIGLEGDEYNETGTMELPECMRAYYAQRGGAGQLLLLLKDHGIDIHVPAFANGLCVAGSDFDDWIGRHPEIHLTDDGETQGPIAKSVLTKARSAAAEWTVQDPADYITPKMKEAADQLDEIAEVLEALGGWAAQAEKKITKNDASSEQQFAKMDAATSDWARNVQPAIDEWVVTLAKYWIEKPDEGEDEHLNCKLEGWIPLPEGISSWEWGGPIRLEAWPIDNPPPDN